MNIKTLGKGLIKKTARWLLNNIEDEPLKKPPLNDAMKVPPNDCCICKASGGVMSKYLPKPAFASHKQGKEMARAIMLNQNFERPLMPITWCCRVCHRPVCFNCTLVVPHSDPVQFYEDTYCSETCRKQDEQHWCKQCHQSMTCEIVPHYAEGLLQQERGDEIWSCYTDGCPNKNMIDRAYHL